MRTIFNMRPGAAGLRLQNDLARQGASAVYWPAFSFDVSGSYRQSKVNILNKAREGALLVVVSPTTVEFMADLFNDLPQETNFACVGEPTAKALQKSFPSARHIIYPHGTSQESGSEILLGELKKIGLPKKVVFVRGDTGRNFLPDALRAEGVEVTIAPVYKRIPLKISSEDRKFIGEGLSPVTFLTSTDSVEILESNVGSENIGWFKEGTVFTIHPRIQNHLEEKGFKNVRPVVSSDAGLAAKILQEAECCKK